MFRERKFSAGCCQNAFFLAITVTMYKQAISARSLRNDNAFADGHFSYFR